MVLPLLARLMAPPTQTLHTLAPTPSTVSFTVSTRPEPTTLAAKLGYHVSLLTRFVVVLCTLALLWLKWSLGYGSSRSTEALLWMLGGPQTARLLKAVGGLAWVYAGPAAVVVLFVALRRAYIEESLTVLHGLGVQTSSSAATFLQSPSSRFIPTSAIQDIVIHEAFRGFEVRFYLAIIVTGEEDVVVVFPSLLPRRAILEEVWRGTRRCLWERVPRDSGQERKDEAG